MIDSVEDLARERVKALFGAEHANVQPHAGANANMAAYLAMLEPGDTVLGLRLDQGGHLTHGSPVNASGRLFHFVLRRHAERRAHRLRPGARPRPRAPAEDDRGRGHGLPRIIESAPFRQIADEVGALFLFDAPHRRAHRRRPAPRTRSVTAPTS